MLRRVVELYARQPFFFVVGENTQTGDWQKRGLAPFSLFEKGACPLFCQSPFSVNGILGIQVN
jgi:hypothetical protein